MSNSVKSLSDIKKPEPEKKSDNTVHREQQAPDKLNDLKDKPKGRRGDNPDAFGF